MSPSDDEITVIQKDIADIKIILDKLNNHIMFIDKTYDYVKNTLTYLKEKINLLSGKKLLNASQTINPD